MRKYKDFIHRIWGKFNVKAIKLLKKKSAPPSTPDTIALLWLCYRNEERDVNTGGQDSSTGTKKVLILFIGGCTYAEISALRFLSQQEESTTEYSVATTSMINGNNFISGLTTELNDALTPF